MVYAHILHFKETQVFTKLLKPEAYRMCSLEWTAWHHNIQHNILGLPDYLMFLDSNSHNIKKDFRLLYVAMFCLSFSRNCEREKFFWASVYHMINREGVITCLESCTQWLYSSACPEKTCSCLTGGKNPCLKDKFKEEWSFLFLWQTRARSQSD